MTPEEGTAKINGSKEFKRHLNKASKLRIEPMCKFLGIILDCRSQDRPQIGMKLRRKTAQIAVLTWPVLDALIVSDCCHHFYVEQFCQSNQILKAAPLLFFHLGFLVCGSPCLSSAGASCRPILSIYDQCSVPAVIYQVQTGAGKSHVIYAQRKGLLATS